jgi:drug/metabolite transporter (DMT)-like permease
MGMRFSVASLLLLGYVAVRRGPRALRVTRRQARNAGVVGALLLLGGNGGVVMAERTVPSGVAALLVATVPMWMVVMEWLRPAGTRPTGRTLVGLAVGFAGMIVLVGPARLAGGASVDPLGAGLLLMASLSWAAGSTFARGAALPKSALLATAMEMLCGGAALLLAGAARGELATADPSAFTTESVLALLYLVVFGSLVGFSAYVWLLGVTTAARVSTYAYVNPIVAVMLGWAILDEPITPRVLAAAAVIILAVAVITTGKRPAAAPAESAEKSRERPPRERRDAA